MVQEIRREMFKGNLIEAYSMAKGITGRKLNYGTNLPLGNLRLDFSHPDGDVHDYRRDLNLDTAVASVSYRVGQASFRRQVFASNPDHVIVVRLSCDRPSCLSCRISLDGAENPFGTRTHGHDTILLDGQAYETIHSDGKTGVSFHGRLQVVARGGETSAEDGRILVDGADTVILVVGLGTTQFRHVEDRWKQPWPEATPRFYAIMWPITSSCFDAWCLIWVPRRIRSCPLTNVSSW
jgi:alpha-L-fucosidase 2